MVKAVAPSISTPDSIPSLSEVTRASSDNAGDDNEDDGVTRVLFEESGECEYEVLASQSFSYSRRGNGQGVDNVDDKDSLVASDCSLGSLASLVDIGDNDHATSNSYEAPPPPPPPPRAKLLFSPAGVLPGIASPCTSSPLEFDYSDFENAADESSNRFYDASSVGCHGGLNLSTTRQLVGNVFSMLDGYQGQSWRQAAADATKAPSVVSDGAETTVTSNTSHLSTAKSGISQKSPRVESLERECSTLKEIIKVDSVTILQLKTSVERLRHDSGKKQVDLDSLRKERDLLREREEQHQETIKVLKKELDALTQLGAASSPETHKELEQLRIENELFATQIIENEVEMREIRSVLDFLDRENAQMREELKMLQGKLLKEKQDASGEEQKTNDLLTKKVEALANRLDHVEQERDQANEIIEERNRKRDEELESIKKMVQLDHLVKEAMQDAGSGGGEEIEVTLSHGPIEKSCCDGEKRRKDDAGKEQEAQGGWNLLCDCFPTPGATKETA